MEVLRLKLRQAQANYRKEETIKNKMTYPLPPFSTVIGALHAACNFTEYHPMDLSIQGSYESMHKEAYTDYCFLNSVMDDRGILVKLKNSSMLSNAFDKVATAKKSQGNSFRKGITIDVYNEELIKEYREIKDKKDELAVFKKQRIEPVLAIIKKRKKSISTKKKMYDKGTTMYDFILKRENEIKSIENEIKSKLKAYENNQCIVPYKKFASLTTSLAHYEVLNNIQLIIHIKSDKNTLDSIKDNIYNLQSLGRSEDFIEVEEVTMTTVSDKIEGEVISSNSAYIALELVRHEDIIFMGKSRGIEACGTKYYLNKNYRVQNNKRLFEKQRVVYMSNYAVDEESKNIFIDEDIDETYIINFI